MCSLKLGEVSLGIVEKELGFWHGSFLFKSIKENLFLYNYLCLQNCSSCKVMLEFTQLTLLTGLITVWGGILTGRQSGQKLQILNVCIGIRQQINLSKINFYTICQLQR